MNQRKEMESKSHNPTHQEKSALRLMEKTCTTQGVQNVDSVLRDILFGSTRGSG